MDGGKTWYLCDSEKNTECRQTNCWMCRRYGSRAIYESRQLQQPCNLTSRREYAMEDNQGRLIRVKIWKDRQRGFLCEFNYEEKNGGQEHE